MVHVVRPAYGAVMLAALLLPGCAGQSGPKKLPAPFADTSEPLPPAGSARGLSLPEMDDRGRFVTINSGVDAQEAVWHLRAAFNVAAMSCPGDPGIVKTYNRLLTERAPAFGIAYQSEARKNGEALDRHMTQLYNFFAQPPSRAGFCRAVVAEMPRALAARAEKYPAYAIEAVRRIEAPFTDFYRAYAAYQQNMAEWRVRSQSTRNAGGGPPQKTKASPQPTADAWRIQIGAFTGMEAAKAAWEWARKRVPSLSGYKPYYESVPGHANLIRVQTGNAETRDLALKLCATAAVGGFDCIPVPKLAR